MTDVFGDLEDLEDTKRACTLKREVHRGRDRRCEILVEAIRDRDLAAQSARSNDQDAWVHAA